MILPIFLSTSGPIDTSFQVSSELAFWVKKFRNRFSRWQPWHPPWISDRNNFIYVRPTSHPDASYKVSSHKPGNLIRGSCWLCTQNLYANFRPWFTRHPKDNKRINSPDLLIFSKFHRHILKNRTMLFPTIFISASEKIGMGLKKQATNFYFIFTQRRVVQYSCFDFFFSNAKWRYFQLSGLWDTYLTYQIRRTATHVHFEIHKMLNFSRICSSGWNICVEYDFRDRLPLTGALILTGTRKHIHHKVILTAV